MGVIPTTDATDWPQSFGPEDWHGWSHGGSPVADGIDALAELVLLRRHQLDGRRQAEAALLERALPPAVLTVGVAGPVASGKSTIASALADRLEARNPSLTTGVVSTDGFLRPNADLDEAGLSMRKGFPESYDLDALRALHRAVHAGVSHLSVPVYSHETYDIAPDARVIERPDVLVIEGVNALQGAPDGRAGPGDLVDVGIYLDVVEATVVDWYVERFVELTEEARSDETSFYAAWAAMPDEGVRQVAREVWDAVNAVNLRDHIEPSRHRADIEIVKAPDHTITQLRLHP